MFGNSKEIAEYKEIRDRDVPLKPVTVLTPEQMAEYDAKHEAEPASEPVLETPLHDTGNMWYSIGSFILPVFGAIGAALFKRFRYMRNYKACRKGAIAGFAVIGALIAIFGIALVLSVL